MKNILSIIFAIVVLLLPDMAFAAPKDINAALDSLDWYVKNHETFLNKKLDEASKSKIKLSTAHTDREKVAAYEEIADKYQKCNVDSALLYYNYGRELAKQMSDSVTKWRLDDKFCALLPVLGVTKEAVDIYQGVPVHLLSDQEKVHHFKAGNRLYNYLISINPVPRYKQRYFLKMKAATDSLLCYLQPGTNEYRLYKAQQHIIEGNNSMAFAELYDLLENASIYDNLYAQAAGIVAYYYRTVGNKDEEKFYLILSAISDLASGTREYTSLQTLGEMLYKEGDVDRAYDYLKLAIDDAFKSGSVIRQLESMDILPLIINTLQDNYRRKFMWLSIVILILFLAIVALVVILIINRRKLHKANINIGLLRQSEEQQNNLVGALLLDASNGIGQLASYNKLVARKIKAKQSSDLFEIAESGKMVDARRASFLEQFDQQFNSLYPNFLEQVNTLLVEDKQLRLDDSGRFTPELRIIALIGMGVDNTSAIAEILGLSVNTIYTYRNKVKSKARNREDFDRQVKNILSI